MTLYYYIDIVLQYHLAYEPKHSLGGMVRTLCDHMLIIISSNHVLAGYATSLINVIHYDLVDILFVDDLGIS